MCDRVREDLSYMLNNQAEYSWGWRLKLSLWVLKGETLWYLEDDRIIWEIMCT